MLSSSRTGIAHGVDPGAPLRRAGDAAAKVGPDRLEGLTAQGQHECELVAVARLREVVKAKTHRRLVSRLLHRIAFGRVVRGPPAQHRLACREGLVQPTTWGKLWGGLERLGRAAALRPFGQ